jgi:hypothetical protein
MLQAYLQWVLGDEYETLTDFELLKKDFTVIYCFSSFVVMVALEVIIYYQSLYP